MATDNEQVTKRERQKQRRDAKVAEERRQLAKARRNRLIAVGALAVLALAALGAVIAGRLSARQAREDNIAAAAGRLEELGCTEISEQPNLGGGHITDPSVLAASAPEVLYPDRPATSGQHVGQVALTGVYDEQIDERLLVHNLEHGYVNFFYDDDADAAQVEDLRTYAQGQIDGDRPKIVVAPYGEALPGEANFATVAWDRRQLCGQFDVDVATAFLDQHYNSASAPERFIGAHISAEAQGVLDPGADEGPLLFPPLGAEAAPNSSEQPEGSSESPGAAPQASAEASEEGSPDASGADEGSPEASASPDAS